MASPLEVDHFCEFRRLVGEFGTAEVHRSESPDFIVLCEPAVGVEHTELLIQPGTDPHPMQAMEAQDRHIVDVAQEHARLWGMPAANVSVNFSPHEPLKPAGRIEVGRAIARVCWAHLPADRLQSVVIDEGLPGEVDFIAITRLHPDHRHCWDGGSAGWGVSDVRERLQQVIDQKNAKVGTYRTRCTSCWLLIGVDGLAPSSFIDPGTESLEHHYQTSFDRIFLLLFGRQRLHELRVARSDGSD